MAQKYPYAPPTSLLDMEINLAYLLAMGIERLVDDIEKELHRFGTSFHHQKKQRFMNIVRACETVKKNANIMDYTDYAEGLKGKEEVWMGYYENALYLCRVLLLLLDRIAEDPSVYEGATNWLASHKSYGIVTDAALKKFTLNK